MEWHRVMMGIMGIAAAIVVSVALVELLAEVVMEQTRKRTLATPIEDVVRVWVWVVIVVEVLMTSCVWVVAT